MPEKINRRDVLMRIGFTGTRQGMTERQRSAVRDLLASYAGTILHHGDAIGADAEAHDIALALGCAIVIHPPAIATERAFKTAVEIRAAKPYLVRNKHIVRETALLIAAPAEPVEQLRSGTWSTVRYAHPAGAASPSAEPLTPQLGRCLTIGEHALCETSNEKPPPPKRPFGSYSPRHEAKETAAYVRKAFAHQ